MIVYLTYLTSAAVIITKWFDCTTTLKHINGIETESNPIARALMYKFGIIGTVWFAFVVAVVVTVLSQLYVQVWTEYVVWDIAYVITGAFTALIQGATAFNNHQGRANFVTDKLFYLLRRINHSLSKWN